MDEHMIKGLMQFKQAFLENRNLDPLECPYLDRDIAASWVRSRQAGVDPYTHNLVQILPYEEYEERKEKNHLLVKVAAAIFDAFDDQIAAAGYRMFLDDNTGVVLAQRGTPIILPAIEQKSFSIRLNETVSGTIAYSLCQQLKRPVQLLGIEHYCVVFNNVIVTSAPIMDESDEMIAVLSLSQHCSADQQVKITRDDRSLCLAKVIAAAIEARLKLEKLYTCLGAINRELEATLPFVDEGLISIDRHGRIFRCNREGARILGINPDNITNHIISEFLDDSQLMELLDRGKDVDIEENIGSGSKRQPYIVSVRPILRDGTREVDMAVLRFVAAEKINSMLAGRTGSMATHHFEDIIGESSAIKIAIARGQRFASLTEHVLLTGESGTGKELFAQAIHNQSRPQGPFISINCAAMPRDLIESELFGYEGGSFTGAERSGKPGKIELAHKGTLFLDEIGDMRYGLQAALLRVLQDKQVMRVGGSRYRKVDFRLIASSNKNLYQATQEKVFREDLYFRLSVLTISLPSLRERIGDIELLSHYFIERYSRAIGVNPPRLSPSTLRIINEYDWPGNIRQLENALIYAVNVAEHGEIEPEHLPEVIIKSSGVLTPQENMNAEGAPQKKYKLKQWESEVILRAMKQTSNNVNLASELLGMNKSTLYRRLRAMGMVFRKTDDR